jgi:cell division transport system permease protein
VRPEPGRDVEAEVRKAVEAARAFPGIAEVTPYSKEQSARLLEPWLGSGSGLEDLPVPRLIVLRAAPGAAVDVAALRRLVGERAAGASLDDHRDWIERMRAMANTAAIGGFALLGLMLAVTILCVTFATRSAMATNRGIVEVLHFIGAKDSYIAGLFLRHFLMLGLKGGALGGGAAILLFALIDLAGGWFAGTAAVDQIIALLGTFSIGPAGFFAVLAQVVLIAAVTGITSGMTVKRTLATIE